MSSWKAFLGFAVPSLFVVLSLVAASGASTRNDNTCTSASFSAFFAQHMVLPKGTNITMYNLDDLFESIRHDARLFNHPTMPDQQVGGCNISNSECYTPYEIFSFSDLTNDTHISSENFEKICPIILFNLVKGPCGHDDGELDYQRLSELEVFGYGFLFCLVIIVLTSVSFLLIPFTETQIFKRALTFLVGLATGCVVTNSILNLIPEALDLEGLVKMIELEHDDEEDLIQEIRFKGLLVVAAVFLFFNVERWMKILIAYNGGTDDNKSTGSAESGNAGIENPHTSGGGEGATGELQRTGSHRRRKDKDFLGSDVRDLKIVGMKPLDMALHLNHFNAAEEPHNVHLQVTTPNLDTRKQSQADLVVSDIEEPERDGCGCCTYLCKGMSQVKPVAWMVVFGDGIANFVDGLTIGAGMRLGFLNGLTLSISVWLDNFPQELGDFALLMRAGMRPLQAIFYNEMSGLVAFVGMFIGAYFGADPDNARWIFAVSAGAFLYLGLGVFLAEMNEEAEDEAGTVMDMIKVTLIQCFGFLTGAAIITVLVFFSDYIELS